MGGITAIGCYATMKMGTGSAAKTKQNEVSFGNRDLHILTASLYDQVGPGKARKLLRKARRMWDLLIRENEGTLTRQEEKELKKLQADSLVDHVCMGLWNAITKWRK